MKYNAKHSCSMMMMTESCFLWFSCLDRLGLSRVAWSPATQIYISIYDPRHKHKPIHTQASTYKNVCFFVYIHMMVHKTFEEKTNGPWWVMRWILFDKSLVGSAARIFGLFFIFPFEPLPCCALGMCSVYTHRNVLLSYVHNDNFDIPCHGSESVSVYRRNSRKWWK